MKKDLLVIFAKEPVPGRVKTRLAKDVGIAAASALYDLMLRHVVKSVISPQYDIVICKTPESGSACFEEIVPGAVVRDQPEGDLGEKMSGVFKAEFARGYRRICIIGTDCPGITSSGILRAFELLGKFQLVLGPSCDGGYHLVGLSVFHPELFEGIAWGTDEVLSDTLGIARSIGIDYGCLAVRVDIDEIAGLERYMSKNPGTELSSAFAKILQECG
jgi:rSAM/selenodomain-associated transferase 1